jgi:hypothetical protein
MWVFGQLALFTQHSLFRAGDYLSNIHVIQVNYGLAKQDCSLWKRDQLEYSGRGS